MKKRTKRILAFTIGLPIYLNIGWAIETYCYNNVEYVEPSGLVAQFAAGGWGFVSDIDTPEEGRVSLRVKQIIMSIIWPIFLLVIVASWIIFIAVKLLWLFFAGGFAKLFGIG